MCAPTTRRFANRIQHHSRITLLATLLAIVAIGFTFATDVAKANDETPQQRLREAAPWLPPGLQLPENVTAFEEHADFVYLAGQQEPLESQEPGASCIRLILLRPEILVVDRWPYDSKRDAVGSPTTTNVVDMPRASGEKLMRAVRVYHAPDVQASEYSSSIQLNHETCHVKATQNDRAYQLDLPADLKLSARIKIDTTDKKVILAQRRLPAGIMPHGAEGIKMIERWDSAYRRSSRPGWDKGAPSPHLTAMVSNDTIQAGRAVVLGCGTGTNAIYLAQQGFDVSAIDIAPTALNLAEKKAENAGVKVRWLLADVTAMPTNLGKFDFIFDRGCYHGIRSSNAAGYVATLKQLSKPGTNILILAGNANEQRHYGPPRVKEDELRADFASDFEFTRLKTVRFDSVDPQGPGALAWSILLRRRTN